MNNKFVVTIALLIFVLFNFHPVFGMKMSKLEEEFKYLESEAIVFTATRQEQKVSETAAAAYVITHEDIRRSGVTTIPEALRMAPGVQVAQINSNIWAISIREFNHRYQNKLLVLMDGRTVYSHIFSGVYWHAQDTLIEDVKRIEVIRGPSGALWGANAYSGIINIITKSAKKTQGGILTAGGGNEERGFGSIRYGGKIGDQISYRAYVKGAKRDNFITASGNDPNDAWDSIQGGFRIDGDVTDKNSYTLQGDLFDIDSGEVNNAAFPLSPFSARTDVKTDYSGGNVMGIWNSIFSDTSDMTLKLYYDHTEETFDYLDIDTRASYRTRTYDVDFQHHFQVAERNNVTWGLGFRYISNDTQESIHIRLDPSSRDSQLYSGFIQDEITVIKQRLKFILGSKIEHHDYTGFEIQPNARLLWTPHKNHTLWASVSRAIRTPSRADRDTSFYSVAATSLSPPTFITVVENGDYDSEELLSYEMGYRINPIEKLSFDLSAFYNLIDNMQSSEFVDPFADTFRSTSFTVVPIEHANKESAQIFGIEALAKWQALEWWKIETSYSFMAMDVNVDADSKSAAGSEGEEKLFSRNQFKLSSLVNLPGNFELDTFFRYADEVDIFNIDSYIEMDIRLGWKPVKELEISLVGRNLLDNSHPEFIDSNFNVPITEVERSLYGKILWRF